MTLTIHRKASGGNVAPTSPSLTNLAAWWRADAITGLTDGQKVASWLDSSVNANNLSQSTGAIQPTYKVNQLNGLPGVVTTGAGIYMTMTAPLTQSFSMVAVVNPNAASGQGLVGGNVNAPEWGPSGGTTAVLIANQILLLGSVANGFIDGAANLAQVDYSTPNGQFWLNTASAGTFAQAVVFTLTTGYLFSTFAISPGGESFIGTLYEMLVYNTVITSAQRAQNNAYLKRKWSI